MADTRTDSTTTPTKQRRGFACMTPDARKRIASLGGKAAHVAGKAHEWTAAEASAAGRKGGAAKHAHRAQVLGTGQDVTKTANTVVADTTPETAAV